MTEQEAKDFVLKRCPLPAPSSKPLHDVPENILALEKRLSDTLPTELLEWLPRAPDAQPDEGGSVEAFNSFQMMVDFLRPHARIHVSPEIDQSVTRWMKGW